MQVYGGYGYMKDYPVEQFLRDAKAHSIFEGTNGIQALTLTGGNLGRDSEGLFKGHLEDIDKFCKSNRNHQTLAGYVEILETAKNALVPKTNVRLYLLTMSPFAGQPFELNRFPRRCEITERQRPEFVRIYSKIDLGIRSSWRSLYSPLLTSKSISGAPTISPFFSTSLLGKRSGSLPS